MLDGAVSPFAGLSSTIDQPHTLLSGSGQGKSLVLSHPVVKGGGHFSHLFNMNKSSKHGPQYPAQGGAKIQGEPTISVAAQGTEGSLATDVPGQDAGMRGPMPGANFNVLGAAGG